MAISHLKKTCKHFNIEFNKDDSEKNLTGRIRKFFRANQMELDYTCENCGGDIPDVPFCPWCNAFFNEPEEEIADANLEQYNPKPKHGGSKKGTPRKQTGKLDWKDGTAALSHLVDKHKLEVKSNKTYISYFFSTPEGKVKIFSIRKSKWLFTVEVNVDGFELERGSTYLFRKFTKVEAKKRRAWNIRGILKVGSIEELEDAVKQIIRLAKKGNFTWNKKGRPPIMKGRKSG